MAWFNGMFGGGNPLANVQSTPPVSLNRPETNWVDILATLGAALQDTGAAYGGRQGGAMAALETKTKRLRDQKQYQDTISGLFGAQNINNVQATPHMPMAGAGAELANRQAAGAYNGPMFGGAAGKLPVDQVNTLAQILPNLDPSSGYSAAFSALSGAKGTEYSTEPRFTADGKAYVVGKDGTVKYLDPAVTPRERVEVAGNGVAYNPFATKAGTTFNDPNKAFGISPDGQLAPNKPFQTYEMGKARAGASQTNLNVNNDKTFGAELSGGAAKLLDASAAAARSGVDTINTANQIRNALATGKVTAGPGATAVQFFNQISGGDPQKLAATRDTIQGLSKLTLSARGALKGQGQVSDYESKLLAKASSGDIDSMSIPEIETVVNVADRLARQQIKANSVNVERAKNIPGTENIVGFYSVDEPAPYQAPANSPNAKTLNGKTYIKVGNDWYEQ